MSEAEATIGRPTDYSDELVREFCRRVASGRAIYSVCKDDDMPSDTTIWRWRQEKPEFKALFEGAREDRLEGYSGKLLELAERVMGEKEVDFQRVNAAANAIDKAARLQAPKQRIEHSGPDGSMLRIVISPADAEL